jgi:hypothetical protein
MNDELRRVLKEAVVGYTGIYPEKLKKVTKKISGNQYP